MLLTHRRRWLFWYGVMAKYRLDTYLPDDPEFASLKKLIRCHPKAIGKKPIPFGLKLALEEMGVLFLKLGQLLSTRSDLLPSHIIAELALLQDNVTPFASDIAKQMIADAIGCPVTDFFADFDDIPLAAASIAQVHTATLTNGQAVVVKVVRPRLREQISQDFDLLSAMAEFVSARVEMARRVRLCDIVADYRKIMTDELDLTLEAKNSQTMRRHFLGSPLIYVPKVYHSYPTVMVTERIYGVPISHIETIDRLGYDRAVLAKQGLTIFFAQVFDHNFFHADMHAGNIFVETTKEGKAVTNPRYIGLDCAIMGQLSPADQLTVARMLLSVMNQEFDVLVDIMAQAGWIPPTTDRYRLGQELDHTVSPMVSKPMSEVDFAGVLYAVLAMARRHQISIPPNLALLLKTLVHVEGLGRMLYADLDIWQLARPILTRWVANRFDPAEQLVKLKQSLPHHLLAAANLPALAIDGVQSVALMGGRQELLLRELQLMRQDILNAKRYDWLAFAGVLLPLSVGAVLVFVCGVGWLFVPFFVFALCVVLWRVTV